MIVWLLSKFSGGICLPNFAFNSSIGMCVMVDGFSTHPKLDEDFCHETYYNIEECLQTFPHVDKSYIYSISTFCDENGGQLYMVDSPKAERGTWGLDQKPFLHEI